MNPRIEGIPSATLGRERIDFAVGGSALGCVLVAGSPTGLCAILMGDDSAALIADLQRRFPNAVLTEAPSTMAQPLTEIVELIDRPHNVSELPIDLRGTEFQRSVWKALRAIPMGSTASYTDVAREIGRPESVRAVAQACAANSLAIVVPCHRVVRSDGGLSGYRWGTHRKQWLLDREAASVGVAAAPK